MFLACTASNSIWKIIIISNNCVKDCCNMNWHNGLFQRSINTFPVANTGFLPLRTPLVTITELTPQGIFLCDILFEEGIIPFLAQYCQSKLQATRGCSLPFPGQAAHYEIHLPLTHTCIYIQQLSKSAVGIILPCCPGQTLHLKEITVQSSKSWVSVSLTAAGCRCDGPGRLCTRRKSPFHFTGTSRAQCTHGTGAVPNSAVRRSWAYTWVINNFLLPI